MRSLAKYFLLFLVSFSFLTTHAWAADYLVIVNLATGTNPKDIASAYEGKLLDALPGDTYLMVVRRLTPKYPVSGVLSMDSDSLMRNGRSKGGVISGKTWHAGRLVLCSTGIEIHWDRP